MAMKPKSKNVLKDTPPSLPPLLEVTSPTFRRTCLILAGVIALGMIAGVVWMSGQDVLWPKDSFSDVNTLMAAEDFANYGFLRLRFLPVHYVPSVGEHPSYYTHYPPLPDVVCGLVQLAGGRWDENKGPAARPQTSKISSRRRDFCIVDAFATPESAIIRSRDGVCQTQSGRW